MSVLYEFTTTNDLSFVASSSKPPSRDLFTSSRYINHSSLPERGTLLRSDQLPNTPVTSWTNASRNHETRQQRNNYLTRMTGYCALNRGYISGFGASNDDRMLPVVQLHPFTRKEWRPSNSIHGLSSSSSNSSPSSASVASSVNLITRSMTFSEISNGEKKQKQKKRSPGDSLTKELGIPRHKTTLTSSSQAMTAGHKADRGQQQILKNTSIVNGINRGFTFLLPQPSTHHHPTTDPSPRVIPPPNDGSPTISRQAPHAIRRSTTTIASGPVKDRDRTTTTGPRLCLRSSTFNDCDRCDAKVITDPGKTRSPKSENPTTISSSPESHRSQPEIVYHRSKTTTDSMSVRPVQLRSRRTKNDGSPFHLTGTSSMSPIGVKNNRKNRLDEQGTRPFGFESQLTSLLKVTLEEMRRTQPSLNALPNCFHSYQALVGSTYGEDRIRSGMRHNARNNSDTKIKRSVGFRGRRSRPRPPKGPARDYTLPNLFGFLENDSDRDRDRETDTERQIQRDRETNTERPTQTDIEAEESPRKGILNVKMTYNSRITSPCSSQTSELSGTNFVLETGHVIETDVVIETGHVIEADVVIETASPCCEENNPSEGLEIANSVLSFVSSQSDIVRENAERLTNENKERSIETVPRKTALIVTVPVATERTVNSSLETETMESHLDSDGGVLALKTESLIEGQIDDEQEKPLLSEHYEASDESVSKVGLDAKRRTS